jgi:hypothetical protein
MLCGEAANNNCIVFGLTLKPMIYHIQGQHVGYEILAMQLHKYAIDILKFSPVLYLVFFQSNL